MRINLNLAVHIMQCEKKTNKTEKQVFQTLKREHHWGEKSELSVKRFTNAEIIWW